MRLTFGRFRLNGPRVSLLVAVVVGICFAAGSRAEVRQIDLEDLAEHSDLVVVAEVVKIEDGPAHLKADEGTKGPLDVATARVIETWKGNPSREVRYVVSPDHMCDISHAEKGERVVLFLESKRWRRDKTYKSIAHSGRGRMPLGQVKGESYAVLQADVILPPGAPTITEKKTIQISVRATEPGKPPETRTVTYSATSVEVEFLRKLVMHQDGKN
jgi:hypothetical protein